MAYLLLLVINIPFSDGVSASDVFLVTSDVLQ